MYRVSAQGDKCTFFLLLLLLIILPTDRDNAACYAGVRGTLEIGKEAVWLTAGTLCACAGL